MLFIFKVSFQCDVAFGPHSLTPEQCGFGPPGPTVRKSKKNVSVISIIMIRVELVNRWLFLASSNNHPTTITRLLPRRRSWTSSGSSALRKVIWFKCRIHCRPFSRYWECFNGVLTSVKCPYCNWYDAEKGQCNQVGNIKFSCCLLRERCTKKPEKN